MMLDTAPSLHVTIREKHSRNLIIALLLGAAALILAGWANADPPSRVARLSYISGAVSFSPAGEDDWVEARINRPLGTGDRLWVDAGARAELQVGSAVFHMGGGTSVTLLNLDNRVAQLQLAQGTLNIRVQRIGPRDVVEVDTPNLAYSIRRPGGYRIDVDPARNTTTVATRSGQAEVHGDGAAYVINAGRTYRFSGTSLRDSEYIEAPRLDEFDRWTYERDRRGDNSVSARYVSRDVIGYEDLDENGSWRRDAGYGNVWVPNRVPAGWAPYRDGHWAWVDPWGWTWIDDAPWGFAVSHYGRWANLGGTWGWIPGPVRAQPVYAPALVAFIGGSNFQIAIFSGNAGGIAWFPLGPRDVYRPSYPVSRRYFNNVNTSNTTVNNTTITNVYNNTNVTNVTYVNRRVPGAVVAVPAAAFTQSQPVAKSAVPVSSAAIAKAQVTPVAAVAPAPTSVRGAAPAGRRPPAEAHTRPVMAKERPPAAPVSFAAKQSALAADPGKPLDAAALAAVKPAAPAPAPTPVVKVVSPTQPVVAPPKQQAAAPDGPQRSEAQKGTQSPEAEKGRSPDAKKGPQPPEAQKAALPPVITPQPAVSVPRAPDAPKAPLPEMQKGSPSEAKKGPQPPEAQKAPQPPASTPQPAVSAPRPPETPKAPPPEAQKPPQPAVSVPRPPETPKASPPEPPKAPPPPVIAPRPPEAPKAPPPEPPKAPPPPVIAPRPPEAPKAPPPEPQRPPQPAVSVPRPPETPRAPPPDAPRSPPPEAQRPSQPAVSVPRPPEAPKAPPPEAPRTPPPVIVPRPPETPRAPPPEAQRPPQPAPSVPRPPEAPKAPPPEAQKAPVPKPQAAKPAEKRGEKKDEEEEKNRKK